MHLPQHGPEDVLADAVRPEIVGVLLAALADLVGDRPTLDVPTAFTMKDGTVVELRRIVADLIEEYARHTGHADLIREAIVGRVGESPPDP